MSTTGNSDKHDLETLSHLLDKATKSANEVLDQYVQLRSELGIPENADEALAAVAEKLQHLRDTHEVDGKIDINMVKPLFQLTCALRINRTAHGMTQCNTLSSHTILGIHLMGIWHGALSAVQWMDSDSVLAFFKHLHRSELSAEDRATRPAKQAAKVEELLRVLRRKIKHTGKSLMHCTRETIQSRNPGKSITPQKLIIAYLESRFEKAVQTVDGLWKDGDERTHDVMTEDMMATDFTDLDPASRKIAKRELLTRLRELAKEKHTTRLFGMKNVGKLG